MSDNKYSCEVIKDLLPLYIDSVCSDESKILVSEHLDECEECSEEYRRLMSKPLNISADYSSEKELLTKVGKKLKKSRKKAAIKGIAVTLAVMIIVGVLLIPDVMILVARRQYIRNPELALNIYSHKDGELDVGRVKLNLPEEYNALPNGLHREITETSYYIILSDPNSLKTSTNQRINVHDINAFGGEAPKLDFSDDLYGGQMKIAKAMDKLGVRQLGFGEDDFYEFMHYLYSADEPDYSFFSSFKKKAAVFAYYDIANALLPSGVSNYHFETDSYKCYGYALSPGLDLPVGDDSPMLFSFNLYDRDIAIELIGFTKSEAEYIMSSLVIK